MRLEQICENILRFPRKTPGREGRQYERSITCFPHPTCKLCVTKSGRKPRGSCLTTIRWLQSSSYLADRVTIGCQSETIIVGVWVIPTRFFLVCYLLFAICYSHSRDTEARGIHVSVCTGRRPGKPDKAMQLREPKVNQPRPRISRSSQDAQGAFQT